MYNSIIKFKIAKQRQKQKKISINPCGINFILSGHWEKKRKENSFILLLQYIFRKENSFHTIMENFYRHSNRLIL